MGPEKQYVNVNEWEKLQWDLYKKLPGREDIESDFGALFSNT